MDGRLSEAIRKAEKGNPDELIVIATLAKTPEAQKILREAIEEHGLETSQWLSEWNSTELDAHNWS